MVTVFGPTWGRRSRKGWRQGSRGWEEQLEEQKEEEQQESWMEEEQEQEELMTLDKRWLSSGELLGLGQVCGSTAQDCNDKD